MSDEHDEETELEAEQFQTALLSKLNGQTEGMQKLVKLINIRFLSQARRLREHRAEHRKDEAETRKWLGWGFAVLVAVIGTAEAIVAIVERLI